eukprot:m.244919 g.244919  ORF g.244919 m.244919 type:complete len:212 (-) comp15847_c0_seq1:1302-1937(-)
MGDVASWNEMYDRWLFSLMFFSSSFFVVLVTALSFTWVRQELKADREWERLYGKRPAKVQAPTTDPQDDRDGMILLRELRNIANSRRDPTVGRRRTDVNCLPMIPEQHRTRILKREGNCKDGSFILSNKTETPPFSSWVVSVLGGGVVTHHDIRQVLDGDDKQVFLDGYTTSFPSLPSLVDHFSASGHGFFEHPLRKNMWSDDAVDFVASR